MASGQKRKQLTLFDCQTKKRRLDEDHADIEDDCESLVLEYSDADSSDLSDQEDVSSHGLHSPPATPGTLPSRKCQDNTIHIDKPSESPTTIIINNRQSSSLNPLRDSAVLSAQSQPQSTAAMDLARGPLESPVQPQINFPLSSVGSKKRSFNSEWYKKFKWLEYSVAKDAAFCYPCRVFGRASPGKSAGDAFTHRGFRDWKHATGQSGILLKHDKCCSHKQSMLFWHEYTKNAERGTTIANRIEASRRLQIDKNVHYLKTIAEVLLLCGRQDIALRGHRESESSSNKGNFRDILNLVSKHDSIIEDRLENGPRNAMYTSAGIQNSILTILGDIVRNEVCDEVKKVKLFSLLVDETKDLSKQEQVSIVLRYVNSEGVLQEHFLTYVQAASLTAASLTSYILETLEKYDLDPQWIVSQGYDGASVMSGQCSGVQQRIRLVAPNAIYVHCYAHTLNLVLVDSVKMVKYAAEFFSLLESLYVFISTTKAHSVFVRKQRELHPGMPPLQLQKLSDTRWACRFGAVNALCRTYDSLLATLQEIGFGSDHAKAIEAKGLYCQVSTFSFIVSLVMFDKILSCTKSLSDQLQSTQVDLAKAADLVFATKSTLEDYRTDSFWEKLYHYSVSIAELHGIEPLSLRHRQRRLPRHLDGLILESVGSRQPFSRSDDYKISIYFPVLDAFLSELSRRFDEKNIDIMRAIQACNPLSGNFLSFSALQPLVESYGLDENAIDVEARLAKRTLMKKDINDIGDVMSSLIALKDAFPELLRLVRISMTIAVNTAHCERSFSTLKRIKTYLRSTMSEQRLNDLAILSIERELSSCISLDKVVTNFRNSDHNRRIMLS